MAPSLVRFILTRVLCFVYFQEQLRRRREEEERIAQQNEFLRASLRGSRKLQALQDNHPLASERPPAGIDNDAFIADEDVERILGKSLFIHSSISSFIHSSSHTNCPNVSLIQKFPSLRFFLRYHFYRFDATESRGC